MTRVKREGQRVWLPAPLGQELASLAEQFDLPASDPAMVVSFLLGFVAIAGIKKGESVVLSRPTREALSTLSQRWGIADDPALVVGCMVGFFMLRVDTAGGDSTLGNRTDVGCDRESPHTNRDEELVFEIDWDN